MSMSTLMTVERREESVLVSSADDLWVHVGCLLIRIQLTQCPAVPCAVHVIVQGTNTMVDIKHDIKTPMQTLPGRVCRVGHRCNASAHCTRQV